jgi:hypothetical protein
MNQAPPSEWGHGGEPAAQEAQDARRVEEVKNATWVCRGTRRDHGVWPSFRGSNASSPELHLPPSFALPCTFVVVVARLHNGSRCRYWSGSGRIRSRRFLGWAVDRRHSRQPRPSTASLIPIPRGKKYRNTTKIYAEYSVLFIWYRTKVYNNLIPGSYYYKIKQAMKLVSRAISTNLMKPLHTAKPEARAT